MISRATPENARALAQLISTRTTKADTFAISTFDTFRVWDPVIDAIPPAVASSADELLESARQSGRTLRIELFPWLSVQSVWNTHGTTLADHLAEVGLPIFFIAGTKGRTAVYVDVTEDATEASIQGLIGIRSAVLTPSYGPPRAISPQGFREVSGTLRAEVPNPDGVDALVGVFDSGIAADALDPWVVRRFTYDVGTDLEPTHGTFVAGLVVASRDLNDGRSEFPRDPARLYDGQVLSRNGASEDIIIERVKEVLEQSGPTGPRVWNCSFNNRVHMDPVEYGTLSQEFDLLSAKHGVLFVQSAGNMGGCLRTAWPPDGTAGNTDALATPAESVYSLTVGSLSHLGGITPVGAVASYSRRGPSFGGVQKPEVTHWSGDVDETLALSGYGIHSVGPGNVELESVGTSFATPIVSSIAANLWTDLETSNAIDPVTPELVKGLVIHSATVANMPIDDDQRPYYGAGVPRGESAALFDLSHTFTTIHEVELRTGINWEKRPFPMPECLFDADRKIKATVSLTLAYAPIIDAAHGDECIRTCVEPSFGRYKFSNGEEKFEGAMGGSHDWERLLVERGKWSPIKTYRKSWKNGKDGKGDWALKLRLTARDSSIEPLTQRVYVIVTVESLDESQPVYQDGLAAVARLHYPSALAVDAGRLRVGNQP
ncbi:MAG: S8 family peptidase [Mycobacterium sp.]